MVMIKTKKINKDESCSSTISVTRQSSKTPRVFSENSNQDLPGSTVAKPDILQQYLWEIRRYKLLTREQEKELADRVHVKGDRQAAHQLVTSNLRLVVKIALQFQRFWMHNFIDLIQ